MVISVGHDETIGLRALDRVGPDADDRDVIAVECLVIIGVDRRSLGSDRMVEFAQDLSFRRIADSVADLRFDIARYGSVRFQVENDIVVAGEHETEAADLPQFVERGLSFLVRDFERRFLGYLERHADRRRQQQASHFIVILF